MEGGRDALKWRIDSLDLEALESILPCFEGGNGDHKLKKMSVFMFGSEMRKLLDLSGALDAVVEDAEAMLLYSTTKASDEATTTNPFNLGVMKNFVENAMAYKKGMLSKNEEMDGIVSSLAAM